MFQRARAPVFAAITLVVVPFANACGGPHSWAPPAPQGAAYRYDEQGPQTRHAAAFATFGRGGAGLFVFDVAHRGEAEGNESSTKDPFAQSTPIDGVTFNAHLAGQGAPIDPRPEASVEAAR